MDSLGGIRVLPMKPFPDQHDLIALFESEPVLTDAGVPWCYNSLLFTRTIGDESVECIIEPGYGDLRFRWLQRGVEVVDLDVHAVSGLRVESENGREALVAEFGERSGSLPLRIQLAPRIHVSWGTSNGP
jgi:hypothetical protein